MRYPGRNSPDIGKWLAETYTKPGDWIVDPMCGVGQMWLSAPRDRSYIFYDQNRDAVGMAGQLPLVRTIAIGSAENLKVQIIPGKNCLVAFSPPYPQAHDAGRNDHQVQMRDEKGDHAIQGFSGPSVDMPKVYANIASWDHPRLAVVVRNRIVEGQEVCWASENYRLILRAGWTNVDWFWRFVYPTRWQQAKLKRDPTTPVISREYILVASCP